MRFVDFQGSREMQLVHGRRLLAPACLGLGLLLCVSVATADIPVPPDGFNAPAQPEAHAAPRLFIEVVDDAQQPQLVIPRDVWDGLRSGAAPAADASGLAPAALQTVIGGLVLAAAAVAGGAIALRRRSGAIAAAAACVVAVCSLAARADLLPFGPAERRPAPAADRNGVEVGELSLELADDGDEVTLILSRDAVGRLLHAAAPKQGGSRTKAGRRTR